MIHVTVVIGEPTIVDKDVLLNRYRAFLESAYQSGIISYTGIPGKCSNPVDILIDSLEECLLTF